MNPQKILFVVAHPDDETLGAGGTIAKATARGDEVKILFLGEGITARYDEIQEFTSKKVIDKIKERNQNAQVAKAFIGKKINFKIDTQQMDLVQVSIDGKPIPEISDADKKVLKAFTKAYSNNLSLSGEIVEQDKIFEIDVSEMLSPYGINSSFYVVFTARGKTIFDNRKVIKFDYTGDGKVMDNIHFSYLNILIFVHFGKKWRKVIKTTLCICSLTFNK